MGDDECVYLFCSAVPHCDDMTHFQQVGNNAATHQPQTQEAYSEEQKPRTYRPKQENESCEPSDQFSNSVV